MTSPVSLIFDDFDIGAYIATPELSARSTPSGSFSASTPSSSTTISTPSGEPAEKDWSHVVRDRRWWSGVMSVEEARDSASFLSKPEFKNASKKKKEVLIARYQNRQQQNRNSQRNFRQRQTKLVEDLREEIERLGGENERLMEKFLGRAKKERKGGEHGCGRKKRVTVEKVLEVLELEIEDGDGENEEE